MKKLLPVLLFALASLLSTAMAQPAIKLPNPFTFKSEVYKNAEYVKHDAVYLYFIHDEGPGKVAITDLPDNLKNALGYDAREAYVQAEQAAAAEKARQEALAARARDEASRTEELHGILVDRTQRGLVIKTGALTGKKKHVSQWSGNMSRLESGEEEEMVVVSYIVWGHPKQDVLKPGTEVHYRILKEGVDSFGGYPAVRAKFLGELQ